MMSLQQLLKDKKKTVLAVLALAEIPALGVLCFSLLRPEGAPAAQPANLIRKETVTKAAPLDLQFLNPKPFSEYRPQTNPFSGPQMYRPRPVYRPPPQPQPQPPRPQPPPPIKIEIVYLGKLSTPEGKSAALVADRLKGGQQFLEVGATVYGWSIGDFTEEQLVIHRPDGTILKLEKGKATVIGEMER